MRRRWERVRGRVTSRNSARVGNPILYGPGMAERSCLITCTTLWGRLQEPRERDSGFQQARERADTEQTALSVRQGEIVSYGIKVPGSVLGFNTK